MRLKNCFQVITLTLLFQTSGSVAEGSAAIATPLPTPIVIPGIHNSFRVTDRIFSGSQPEGDAAFAALARLGVKTILSVDGGIPDVEAASRHGMRYVHLPYGYDGIPTNRLAALAKLATTLSGPFFVHCHHGLHRGPSAVAIMCEASAGWTPAQAEAWMHKAGTATDYPGLYRAAREYQPPTEAELEAIKTFPEITKPSSLVEAMVVIDQHFSGLKQIQQSGWKTAPASPDIFPAQEATLLWEQFHEMVRDPASQRHLADYRKKLQAAAQAAAKLQHALRDSAGTNVLNGIINRVTKSCIACHQKYRNQ